MAESFFHLTIYIQQEQITYFAVKQSGAEQQVIAQEELMMNILNDKKNFAVLDEWLSEQLRRLNTQHSLKKHKKHRCNIILAQDLVMQRSVKLPNMALPDHEKEAYLAAMLTKTFQITETLAFDYIEQELSADQKYQTVLVFAMLNQTVMSLVSLLKKHQIVAQFIGIPMELIAATNLSLTQSAESLIYVVNINGVNLLPWRKQEQQRQQRSFGIIFLSYLFIAGMILLVYCWYISNKTEAQQNHYIELINHKQQVIDELKQNKTLDDQLSWLQEQAAQQQSQYQAQQQLVTQLMFIAQTMPKSSWLTSLEINRYDMVLIGQSIFYDDILQLSESLNQQKWVINSQIEFIKKQGYLLQFQLKLQCSEPFQLQNIEVK